MTRNISFLIYPQFQLLDAAGPISAFEVAGRIRPGAYALRVIALQPGLVKSSSGIPLPAMALGAVHRVDTLIVSGGDGSREAAQCPRTQRFIQACARSARRTSSVCSGTYLLAAAGLLDGKLATTHWSCTTDFRSRFPKVRLDPDRIFVREGRVWTSAGVTAGIDLALALIEQDLGEKIARATARQLVVYHRRPGGQSQFSALLQMECSSGKFAPLLDEVRSSLRHRHCVAELAERVCMSPRQFFRAFQADTGMTPAKAVERLRADAARAELSGSARSVQDVARSCGFGSAERMRRTFLRLYGVSPIGVKQRAY
ncbi:MAG TPA: GlxA family transcriptional regulator [Steroidobacteraceae bacterium]|jgi:transcriptional regulator GlxA family with amidase domain|nr:GlxA family transcriptional regulator [Steroidobacteraceae bacterium]